MMDGARQARLAVVALIAAAAAFFIGNRLSAAAPVSGGMLDVLSAFTPQALEALPAALLARPLYVSAEAVDVATGALATTPVLVVWALEASTPRSSRTADAYGSERMGSIKDLRKYRNAKDPSDNLILTEHVWLTISGDGAKETPANLNTCVIGGSGAGKTISVLEPNLLQMGDKDTVSTDPKGATLPRVGQALVDAGREVVKLDLVDKASSSVWNPLSFIDSYADVRSFARALVDGSQDPEKSSDPVWGDGAADLLTIIVSYLWAWRDKACLTMTNVNAMLGQMSGEASSSGFANLMNELRTGYKASAAEGGAEDGELMGAPGAGAVRSRLRRHAPGDPEAGVEPGPGLGYDFTLAQWDRFVAGGVAETLGGYISTLSTALSPFCEPELERVFGSKNGGKDEIGLDRLGLGETRRDVFVVCSDKDHSCQPILSLFFWEALLITGRSADARKPSTLPHHVQFLFDELYSVGKLPDFERNMSTVRSRNISVLFCLQSLAQLNQSFGENGMKIIRDCCALQVYLAGSGASETRKELSEELGQATVTKDSSSLQASRSALPNQSVSQDVVGRNLLTRQEIGRLRKDAALVTVGNEYVVEDDKMYVFRHRNFDPRAMFDPNRRPPSDARLFDYTQYRASLAAGGVEEVVA